MFDRHPNLKIIAHHFGGMIPYFEGRIGPGLDQMGARTTGFDKSALKFKKRPFDYFKMYYADTAVFGSKPATECGLAFFGADKTVFASDAPFDPEKGPMYIRETIKVIEALDIPESDKAKIFGNAEALKLGKTPREESSQRPGCLARADRGSPRAARSSTARRRSAAGSGIGRHTGSPARLGEAVDAEVGFDRDLATLSPTLSTPCPSRAPEERATNVRDHPPRPRMRKLRMRLRSPFGRATRRGCARCHRRSGRACSRVRPRERRWMER
jgi:hypothetical protein